MSTQDFIEWLIGRGHLQPTSHPATRVVPRSNAEAVCLCVATPEPLGIFPASYTLTKVRLEAFRIGLMTVIGPHAAEPNIIHYEDIKVGQCQTCSRIHWTEHEAMRTFGHEGRIYGTPVHLKVGKKLGTDFRDDPVIITDSRQRTLVGLAKAIVEEVPNLKEITLTDWEYLQRTTGKSPDTAFDTVGLRVEANKGQFAQIGLSMEEVDRNPQAATRYVLAALKRHLQKQEE